MIDGYLNYTYQGIEFQYKRNSKLAAIYRIDFNIFKYRKVRRILFIAFILSTILHAIPFISNLRLPKKEVEVKRKPLSVKFIQRAPRLVKPLELAKRPTVVQRKLTRRIAQTPTRTLRSMRTATIHGGTALASLAPPTAKVDRAFSPQRLELGPEIIARGVENVKESKIKELDEDLLTVDAMDYGRFASFAVQNPDNKQDVKGFIYLALVRYKTNRRDFGGEPDWNTSPLALPNIAEYLNDHTGINAKFGGVFTLDSDDFIRKKIAFLFITGHYHFEYTDAEAKNLGRYLREGGFLLIDDSYYFKGGPFDITARTLVKKALGQDIVFERIPNDHRFYKCFFDFNGPPPGDDAVGSSDWKGGANERTYDHLEAVYIDGRMAVLMSNKSLNNAWNADPHWRPETGGSNVRQLQFAVNIIVYVLTQPGGYTQQNALYR